MSAAIELWRRAAEAADATLARTALADDAVLVSPLTGQFRFEGGDVIGELLQDAFVAMTEIRFLDQIDAGDRFALFAEARVGTRRLEEVQWITLDPDGLIGEVRLHMRPIPAMTALLRGLGPRVARRQRKPAIAGLLTVAGAFLDGVAATGDARLVPLAAPPPSRERA